MKNWDFEELNFLSDCKAELVIGGLLFDLTDFSVFRKSPIGLTPLPHKALSKG